MDPSVFVSYAREDKSAAERLCSELREAHLEPWIDSQKLLPGQNWKWEISTAIRESDFFLALLSGNSVSKRGHVQKEVREALDVMETLPLGKVFFIPVGLEPCVIGHGAIRDLHRINLYPEWRSGVERILAALDGASKSSRTTQPSGTPLDAQDLDDLSTQVTEIVLSTICERTGYPRDMLNEDLDLQADLGIDSIKMVEILVTIQNALALDLDTGEVLPLRTIRSMVLMLVVAADRMVRIK